MPEWPSHEPVNSPELHQFQQLHPTPPDGDRPEWKLIGVSYNCAAVNYLSILVICTKRYRIIGPRHVHGCDFQNWTQLTQPNSPLINPDPTQPNPCSSYSHVNSNHITQYEVTWHQSVQLYNVQLTIKSDNRNPTPQRIISVASTSMFSVYITRLSK